MSDGAIEEEPSKGIIGDVIESIWRPGFGPGVVVFMNVAFACLFTVLLVLAILTNGNWHVLAMTGVAACLFGSVQWFIIEFRKAKAEEASLRKAQLEKRRSSTSQGVSSSTSSNLRAMDPRRRHSGLDGLGRDDFFADRDRERQLEDEAVETGKTQ